MDFITHITYIKPAHKGSFSTTLFPPIPTQRAASCRVATSTDTAPDTPPYSKNHHHKGRNKTLSHNHASQVPAAGRRVATPSPRRPPPSAPQLPPHTQWSSLLARSLTTPDGSMEKGRRPAPARCAAAKRYPPPTHTHAHTHTHTTPSQHCTRDTGEGHSQGL